MTWQLASGNNPACPIICASLHVNVFMGGVFKKAFPLVMTLVIPNKSHTPHVVKDGVIVRVGALLATAVGATLGTKDGSVVGLTEGLELGIVDGVQDGDMDGSNEGKLVDGCWDIDGKLDGDSVGPTGNIRHPCP